MRGEQNQFQILPQTFVNQIMQISKSSRSTQFSTFNRSSFEGQVPQVKNQQQDIVKLKNNNISIWILLHNIQNERIQQTYDYKQFLKMYDKSKYLSQRFYVHINRINDVFDQFSQKLQLSMKCFIYGSIIVNDELWSKAKPYLSNDLVSEIVVKCTTLKPIERQAQRLKCEERFANDFNNRERYSGFVQNFNDALQLQKKILNLAMSKLKPNFFIINQYETIDASDNLNSFHDILINTKAYLKQSFDLKSKEKVLDSFQFFETYIWDEFKSYYQVQEKQKKTNFQGKKQNQKKILDKFFEECRQTIERQYPFHDQEKQKDFYLKILRLYTQQSVVYKSVNHLCKTITSKQMFMKIAFFCKFLNLAIKTFGKKQLGQNSIKLYKQTYYRGSMMSEIEWQQLIKMNQSQNPGYIINLAFTSTSQSKQVAVKFYKNNVKNNILIQITVNKLFLQYYNTQPYCNYLQYYCQLFGLSDKDEQQIIFNCFNVFKVIGFKNDQYQRRILQLQAFSHLQIIKRKQDGQKITQMQQKILDVIVRIQKTRDYAQQLKEQGKHEEMITYLNKIVDKGVDLSISQAQNFIQFMVENGKEDTVQKFIQKIQEISQRTVEQQMKMAVYETIKQQFLQTEFYLQNVLQKKKPQVSQKRQSWSQLMDKCNLNHAISINKQKIGSYQECFKSINQNLEIAYHQIQVAQFLQNKQVWLNFYPYILQSHTTRANKLQQKKDQFDRLYQKLYNYNLQDQTIDQQIKDFLTLQNQKNFFVQFFELQQEEAIKDNELRRDFENYKNKFYERVKLKIRMIIFYYQILIKSERIQTFKSQKNHSSHHFDNLFIYYFEVNKPFFENINIIYEAQLNKLYNYQKCIFFKQYGKFLNGYYNFYDLSTQQKKQLRLKINGLYQSARQSLHEINRDHQQLISLQDIEDNMMEQRLFSQKINKINSIYQCIHSNREDTTLRTESEEQLFNLAQSLRKSRIRSATMYSKKNSFLNQNLCYSSVLKTDMELIQSSTSQDVRQKYNFDFQKLADKIESNMASNAYLKQHTSNAFNDFLRANFWYYKGFYEAAMIFIGKSQDILNNKLKSTEQRMLQQPNQAKRQEIRKKIHIIKQNNEVMIKICILKSKICINYKPNIHNLCISSLNHQESFIRQKLFQLNSSLPEIYYYEVYIILFHEQISKQLKNQKLNSAFKILMPNELSLKKQFLKYYILRYSIVNGIQQSNVGQKIDQIANKYKIIVTNHNPIHNNLLQEHQIYYLFKIQQVACKNKFSFALLLQKSLTASQRKKKPLDKLIGLNQVKQLFVGQAIKHWQNIEEIIIKKFKGSILVTFKLFAFYFVYIQNYYLNVDKKQAFSKLDDLILQLKIIVTKSQRNQQKYNLQQKDNNGFQDKIKTILLYSLRFATQNCLEQISSSILGQIYEKDFIEHRDKYFKGYF